ncbi:MAG: hypothetical protein GY820_37990, partial [Gammaproteobacteria bacterium]|nr:hypothetical protein [Gammaproteobacteria bacterium]
MLGARIVNTSKPKEERTPAWVANPWVGVRWFALLRRRAENVDEVMETHQQTGSSRRSLRRIKSEAQRLAC